MVSDVRKYPLNGTHFTIEDDRQMMQTPADWPWVAYLPLKRSGKYTDFGELEEPTVPLSVRGARLYRDDVEEGRWMVWYYADDDGRIAARYESVEDILADGWVVD